MKRRAIALSMLLAFAAADAQQRPPRDVPYEFALAVLGNDVSSSAPHHAPEIFVGALAPGIRDLPVPHDGRVIGSVVWTTSTIAFFQVPAPPASVRAPYGAALRGQGWQDPPPLPAPAYGGFRDAPGPTTVESFCRDSLALTVRYLPTDDGGTRVRVQREVARGGPCRPNPNMVEASRRSPSFPSLVTPGTNVSAVGDSCYRARGNEGQGTGRMFVSTASPSAMLAGYAAQLADSGWQADAAASSEVATQRFTKPDSLGRPRTLVLSVSAVPGAPACRNAMMYLHEPP